MRVSRALFDGEPDTAIAHAGSWIRASALTGQEDLTIEHALECRQQLAEALSRTNVGRLASADVVREPDATLVAPLVGPRSIVAVGLNYREHANEILQDSPAAPLLFAKWPSALAGPGDDVVREPHLTEQIDYEVELAALIGPTARNASTADALDYVSGYAVANDISARDIQFADGQWTRAKSLNGFCPIGPWLTSSDEITDPQALTIRCRVNGEVRQLASTAQMIHSVAELISYVSHSITLQSGDLLLTGTPDGVAMGMPEPRWLMPGDEMQCDISGLGTLTNRITAPA